MQAGKLFERSVAARKIIALVAVDRHDQIFEEAAILRVDRAAMTCKRQLILLLPADVPGLGHVFAMLAHAPPGDPVLNAGHVEAYVSRPELPQQAQARPGVAGLPDAPQPHRQVLSETELDATHAFDAADERELATVAEHARGVEGAVHAGAALHDGGEGRDVRIEFRLEPDFARQIGIGEVERNRSPDAEVDRAVHLLCHRLRDRDRRGELIARGERAIDAHERRTQSASQPYLRGTVCHGALLLRRRIVRDYHRGRWSQVRSWALLPATHDAL